MPLIHWVSYFEVGHAEIDAQHRELAELLNALADAHLLDQQASELYAILTRLEQHCEQHFAFEEQLIQSCNYPAGPEHVKEHIQLLQELRECQAGIAQGSLPFSSATLLLLKQWLLHHVQGSDRELGRYLAHAATPDTPAQPADVSGNAG